MFGNDSVLFGHPGHGDKRSYCQAWGTVADSPISRPPMIQLKSPVGHNYGFSRVDKSQDRFQRHMPRILLIHSLPPDHTM